MALLKCIDCGHDVSSRALRCPNCGCPISAILATPMTYSKPAVSSDDYYDDDNYSFSDYIADNYDGDYEMFEANFPYND